MKLLEFGSYVGEVRGCMEERIISTIGGASDVYENGAWGANLNGFCTPTGFFEGVSTDYSIELGYYINNDWRDNHYSE